MTNSTNNPAGASVLSEALSSLRLTANLLPIVAPFLAKNDIRYYLSAINVRPHKDGGAVICATNGKALGVIWDRAAKCDVEMTLRVDAKLLAACVTRAGQTKVVTTFNGRLAVVDQASGKEIYLQAGNPVVECTFPIYSKVIPKSDSLKPGLMGSYSYDLLRLADAAAVAAAKTRATSDRVSNALQFFNVNGNPDGCSVFRLIGAPEFVGVLMPIRYGEVLAALPGWTESFPQADDLAAMGGQP